MHACLLHIYVPMGGRWNKTSKALKMGHLGVVGKEQAHSVSMSRFLESSTLCHYTRRDRKGAYEVVLGGKSQGDPCFRLHVCLHSWISMVSGNRQSTQKVALVERCKEKQTHTVAEEPGSSCCTPTFPEGNPTGAAPTSLPDEESCAAQNPFFKVTGR
jgi:hypothetical protein